MKLKLIQTRIPDKALVKIEKLAAREGLSNAAWLRQQILKLVGVDGLGRETK